MVERLGKKQEMIERLLNNLYEGQSKLPERRSHTCERPSRTNNGGFEEEGQMNEDGNGNYKRSNYVGT